MIEEEQKTLAHKPTLEDFEKFCKEFAGKIVQPRTKEQIIEDVFKRLKATYLEKNPYSPTNRFGDNFSQWNFEHLNEIRKFKKVLAENGREDLLAEFEAFVKAQKKKNRKL